MTGFFNQVVTGNVRRAALLALGIAAGVAGFAPTAQAGDDGRYGDGYGKDYRHGDERRYDRRHGDDNKWGHHGDKRWGHDHRGGRGDTEVKIDVDFYTGRTVVRRETEYRPRYHERRVRYWVEPQYKVVSERVWCEPVYNTVSERVWIEPVYRTVYEDVYSPARYEVREVVRYSHGRKIITRERTLIEPACTKRVPRQVCVTPGRWEVVKKQVCVTPGRWDVVERKVCVSEGRWDYKVERIEITGREEETVLDARF
jgi:hypothetical protein